MKRKMIIKIGGSLLFTDKREINHHQIKAFTDIIKSETKHNEKPIIICGGGLIAREFIKAIREFQGNEALCDTLGIDISRVNSKLIITALGENAFPQVPKSIEELSIANLNDRTIVMGGLQPGQSTTSVALEVAEFLNSEVLVILTDVDGIYDKDPNKYKDAKLYKSLSYDDLHNIILNSFGDNQAAAGEYRIFDAVSLQILKRSKIKTFIMSGKDLSEFRKFWNGERNIIGTAISN